MNTKPLRIFAIACLLVGVSEHGLTQTPEPMGSPLGPPVSNAPFSAEATTTIQLVLADGTRLQRTGKARYFRDRIGRVRVEQTIIVDERWESTALQILIHGRHSNPLTGLVEYQLSNISRTEPPADRFRLPQDYTEIQTDPNSPWVGVHFAEAPETRKNIKKLDPNR